MKNCLKLLLFWIKYLLFWIAVFYFFRLFFLLYNYKFSANLTFLEILQTFQHGFSLDLATAAYLCFFPVAVSLFSPIVRANILYSIIFVYSMVLLVGISILGLFDIGLYAEWGTRLSTQILPALESPKGMLACVTPVQMILLLIVEIAIVTGFIFLYRFLFKSYKKQEKQKWWVVFLPLLYGALLVIPMRGGLQRTPINVSRACFSTKLYANHAATNAHWAFFDRLSHNENDVSELIFMTPQECDSIMQTSMQNAHNELPVFIKSRNNKPVNVILIILESFSSSIIEPWGGPPDFTPNLNQLAKEGILFKNFYGTGTRSDRGIGSLLGAYPALVSPYSILYFPEKTENLDFISQYFTKNGYKTHFYYAGEVDFYDTKTFLMRSKYDHIISMYDFPASAKQQNWGVPDPIFYKKIIEDAQTFSTPFFLVTYNISSHSPYDIPEMVEKTYENAITYSDKWLGDFVAQLKKSAFWENSLLVITADHGSAKFQRTPISDPLTYQIPMLWIGGVIDTAFVNETIGMQTDLTTTLVQQLGWAPNPNPFAKNMFGNKSYAFFFNPSGYGFVSPEFAYYHNAETNQRNPIYITNDQRKDSLLRFSEAFMQYLYMDFKKR